MDMLTNIPHPKLNTYYSSLHYKSVLQTESGQQDKSVSKNRINTRESARVQNTSGFFSPKFSDKVSFSGKGFWAKLGEKQKVKEYIGGDKFAKFLKGASNLAWTETLFFLVLGTTLKPATIMILPGAKKEDKEYAATKAMLGAAVDFAIVGTLVTPVKNILKSVIKKIENKTIIVPNNIEKSLKGVKFEAFDQFITYMPKMLSVPLRSALTIALIAPTLKLLFPEESKKKESAKTTDKQQKSKLSENNVDNKTTFKGNAEKVVEKFHTGKEFKKLLGDIRKSIGGYKEKVADNIANKKGIQNAIFAMANNKIIKKIADWGSTSKIIDKDTKKIIRDKDGKPLKEESKLGLDKLNNALMIGFSAFLQTMHVYNIMKNKDMPEERKETLAVNNILAFIIPTIGALTIDKAITKGIKTFTNYVEKARKEEIARKIKDGIEVVEKEAMNKNLLKGIGVLKSVAIFGMMYKYFSTIITTPLADVTTDWLRDKGIIGKPKNKSKIEQK